MKRIRTFLAVLWATVRIASRRLMANRRLAAGLLVGFMVAVAGASSVPVFTAGALQRMLQIDLARVEGKRQPAAVHLAHFEHPKSRTRNEDFAVADQIALETGLDPIGLPVEPVVGYGALEITNAAPADKTKLNPDIDRWMTLSFLSDLQQHVTLIDGQWPRPGKVGGVYEVVVEEAALEKQDFTVGAELIVPVNREPSSPKVKVTVVGAFRRTDPTDPYWFVNGPYDQALFVDKSTFVDFLLKEPRAVPGQYSWYYGIKNEDLKITDVVRFVNGLFELEAQVAQVISNTELFDGPHDLLLRYLVRANRLQMLLLLLAVPPLAVVAYFLIVTSGLMVDGQRQEIAVLRSRGASVWQVLGIYLQEGVLLGGLSLLGGLPLGILLARAMGASSGFLQFVDRKQPELLLPADFWWYGAAAALLAVAAYVTPVVAAARQSIVSYKMESARKLARPFWAKWGLDLLCLALAGYAYYTLLRREPVADQTAGGVQLMQPLDVLAPALFVTGCGLLLLRLMPLLARLVARLADRWAGAPLYLTLNQLSRAPGTYTPVVLLLTLTVGMGLYSAVAARTLERNAADRVWYDGGADVVIDEVWEYIEEPSGAPGSGEVRIAEILPPPWELHYGLPGIEHPARVRKETVIPIVGGKGQPKGKMMAIDPQDFAKVAWFRPDLAPFHLNSYLNLLLQDEEAVLVTPAFLERSKLRLGDRITIMAENNAEVSLVVYGTVPYWPTLNPAESDFFVANLDFIESNLGLYPYQVWFNMQEGAKLGDLVENLKAAGVQTLRASDTRQTLIAKRRDAELNGLLGGLTSGFLLSAGITILGFWLYAALSLRARVLQFGVLRAMGLRVQQLLTAVTLEQVLSVGLGVAAGTGLGLYAAHLFVPFLQQGADSAARTPPFVIVADPADRLRLYLVLLFMLVAGLAGLMAVLSRMRVHEAIKLGEDH